MLLFVKSLIFTVLVPGTVAGLIPIFVFPHDAVEVSAITLTGVAFLFVGVSIYLWCLWDFAIAGRGTPAPIDPPKKLVVRGLYKYCRNPMYMGVLSAIFGWAILFESTRLVIYGICVAISFHLVVVFYEEFQLKQTFGSKYEQYCADVNRWLPFRKGAADA